jgi:hypothetical protein
LETNIDTILKNIEKGIWCETFNQSTLKMKSKSILNEIEVIRDRVNKKFDALEEKLSKECSIFCCFYCVSNRHNIIALTMVCCNAEDTQRVIVLRTEITRFHLVVVTA